jgi:hypothetical protein
MHEHGHDSPSSALSENPWPGEVFRAYEEGKHRRYNLLFAVNGGAFTVAKLFGDPEQHTRAILGNLSLWHFSLGMVGFTIIMVLDIFMFGFNMRRQMTGIFRWQGMLVLTVIGGLLSAGWTLVSFDVSELRITFSVYLISIVAVYLLSGIEKRKGWWRRWWDETNP